ncbi:MAG: hopanoid biosynthesis-associated protein HpnK [Chloroflexia bacterium]
MSASGTPFLILTADDLGRCSAVNEAIFCAHREGVLTSASLMVTGEASAEAVAMAREHPTLAVGLHLVVLSGRPVLPPEQIPHLVGPDGSFPADAFRLGLRCFFSRAAQAELAAEIEAQFRRYAETGLPLDHVDGHCHMHLHPAVLRILLPLAERYGARGFRLPRDRLGAALVYDRRQAATHLLWAAIFALLARYTLKRLRGYRLVVTERVHGLFHTGRMSEGYVLHLLERLDVPSAEIYFHPSTGAFAEPLGPNPGDLATLLSPRVRSLLDARGIVRGSYTELAVRKEIRCSSCFSPR